MVTGVAFAILVMVSLVGIGHVGTVVQVVLVAVFINILIVVTGVSNAVRVRVELKETEGELECESLMLKKTYGDSPVSDKTSEVSHLYQQILNVLFLILVCISF